MTLRKLIENTIVDSNPSWTTRWITFTGGWWKFLPTGILARSVNILTPPPANRGKFIRPVAQAFMPEAFHGPSTKSVCTSPPLPVICSVLFLGLSLLCAGDLSAQTKKKKKKPTHPKAPACATGCKPDTTSPTLDSSTPEDAAAQKELALLARDLHRGTPGAYEKLAAFANKNISSVWGQRAALALGYDDYSKSHAQQALSWLQKAKPETLFYKYPLGDEAKDAAIALPRLNKQLHSEFPYATGEMQDARAQIFYDAHKWHEARTEYEKLATILKDPTNPIRQRALLRAAECRQHPKPAPGLFVKLSVTDPDTDAERLYDLSQAWRSDKKETEMLAVIEINADKYPH